MRIDVAAWPSRRFAQLIDLIAHRDGQCQSARKVRLPPKHVVGECFEISIPGKVFPYGRFECDTSIEYESVVAFGRAAIIEDRSQKSRFFDALMAKYQANDSTRPKGSYPRLDGVTAYALTVERVTGKAQRLPPPEALWPTRDNTMSPELPR